MNRTVVRPTGGRSTEAFGVDAFDERRSAEGAYSILFEHLSGEGLPAEVERVRSELSGRGVVFGDPDPRPFDVDVVPRILVATEWEVLERGLIQRVGALNAFIADVYGRCRIVTAGVLPARVIDEADWYEPAMADPGSAVVTAHVAGPDLVRRPDGEFDVLEDNLRAPSGLAYLLEAREALAPIAVGCGLSPAPLEPAMDALGSAIRNAVPGDFDGRRDPNVVLLSDGPGSSAAYEHRELARRIGMTIATVSDLHPDGDRLLLDGDIPVDVIYRRVDDERLTDPDGSPTRLGDLLIGPLRAGTLGCVNSPGTGIADDKAVHVYVERMIDFYLGEKPLLRSVRGYDLGDPAQLERVRPELGELVIKPRSDFGGQGVMIGPLASSAERRRKVEEVLRDPGRFIAQEPVALSIHPTAVKDRLVGRHVDLRPFVVTDGNLVTVSAGGLTRFARGENEMVVNSGRGGGAKDTWVI